MEEYTIWCMFYAGLVSMRMHPGWKDKAVDDLEWLALVADNMLVHALRRREELWPGSHPQ